MISNGILLFIVCVTLRCLAIRAAHAHCDPNHPDHNTQNCPSPGEVDAAIANVELYYNDNLCEAIKHFHCDHHHAPNDERICGSDDITYENHCLFAHERCKLVLDKHNYNHQTQILTLDVQNHGQCVPPTTTAAPAQLSTAVPTGISVQQTNDMSTAALVQQSTAMPTAAPVQQTTATPTAAPLQQSTTMAAIQNTASIPPSTMQPTTTTAPPTTTTGTMTTTASIHSIIQNVFCQQANVVNCSLTFNILCASDKNYYPNDCELAKAKCKNPSLVEVDISMCTP